jgi:hypothetical protein
MSSVFIQDPGPRFGDLPAAAPPEPDEPELSPREAFKKKLARAWMNSAAPRTWDEPPTDPVTAVVVPAAINTRKGSGAVTPEEIERYRVAEQKAFQERLQRQWISNLSHL